MGFPTALEKLESVFVVSLAILVAPALAGATEPEGFCHGTWSGFLADDGSWGGSAARHSNLFNGVVWAIGGASIRFGADSSKDWTSTNSFDSDIRDGLVAATRSGRENAGTASDVLFGATALWPLLVDAGGISTLRRASRDCDLALEISSDWLESMSFTWMITEATKAVAGRERPYGLGCNSDSDYGSCGSKSRFESFFSGHASLSAAGAALMCKDAIRRNVWGDTIGAKTLACGFGTSAAIGTGILRMVSDKHWMTDVLTGWAVGGLIGWFDTWGPFDIFHFRYDRNGRRLDVAWAPVLRPGNMGVGLAMRF